MSVGLWFIAGVQFVLGLLTTGLALVMLATAADKISLAHADEVVFLLDILLWTAAGLLLVVTGACLLFRRWRRWRRVMVLEGTCVVLLAGLAIWEHFYISASPGDPSGALKAAYYLLMV